MSVVLDDLVAPGFASESELDRLEVIAAGVARTAWANRAKSGLGDDLVQLSRIERMVGAAKLGALAAFDASGQYRFDGQPSAATWMAANTKADRRRVRHQIGVARQARTMPLTEDAYRQGTIGFEHVATLSRAVNADTAEFFAEAEAELVAAARTLDFDLFVRAVRAWMDFVDPDGAEERARKADERRRAHASRTFDGMVRIDAWLDAIGGTEFLAELRRLEKELFAADWAEARARLGDHAKASDLVRTAEQRRADALVEMARRSATCDTPGQPPKWVLNVMVGYATFWNELAALAGETGDHHCPCCGGHRGPDDAAADADDEDAHDDDLDDLDTEALDTDDLGAHPDLDLDDLDADDRDTDLGDQGSADVGAPGASDPTASTDVDAPDALDHDEQDTAAGPVAPRPLPDWWKSIDLRPGAGLVDTRFYDTMCELEDCTPLAARTAISLGLAGTIRRIVFGPDSQILDFGQAVDYFHGPLREAIIIRDRFCRDDGCGLPGRDCQIDHRVPRSRGGPTAATNGECKCGTANRLKGDRMP
ncbi:MAG: DUF222 domain-containing protein [Acidimicrobiales bacterium]|nr:DUF222 domain-containing protein [Acidimicrobiales bacterium]